MFAGLEKQTNNTQRVELITFEPMYAGSPCDYATIRVYYPDGTIVEDQFIVVRDSTVVDVSKMYYEKWGAGIPDIGGDSE